MAGNSYKAQPPVPVGSNLFELIEFVLMPGSQLTMRDIGINENDEMPVRPPSLEELLRAVESDPMIFGVNVAKVREVIRIPKIVSCPGTRPEVLGVFNLRGVPIPAIHLARALGFATVPVLPSSQVLVTEFGGRLNGFVVGSTRRIRRVSWERILPPPSQAFNSVTGVMPIENDSFLFITDFERILMEVDGISPDDPLGSVHFEGGNGKSQVAASAAPGSGPSGGGKRVAVVDDSPSARRAVCGILRGVGFEVMEFSNGELALEALLELERLGAPHLPQVLVSDVEMPRMDGYSLVKRLRANASLGKIPMILHSSLTGDVNHARAREAGADAYVAKFDEAGLLASINSLLGTKAAA